MSVETSYSGSGSGPKRKVRLSWTSASDGTFEASNEEGITKAFRGFLVKVAFIPDTVDIPSNLYDLYLYDPDGLDLLAGQGVNLAQGANTFVGPGVALTDGSLSQVIPMWVDSTMDLQGSSCGDEKSGVVVLYFE